MRLRIGNALDPGEMTGDCRPAIAVIVQMRVA
jgi:hypothetical protein